MTISIEDTLHGSVIFEIINGISSKSQNIFYSINRGKGSSAYYINLLNSNKIKRFNIFNQNKSDEKRVGIYIKTSRKRITPWRYTFLREHQEEIEEMISTCDQTFILLMAGMDGVVSITYNDLKLLLDDKFEENEWISVSRKYNQYYRVDGNDGDKKISVAKKIFPQNIVDFISKEVNF